MTTPASASLIGSSSFSMARNSLGPDSSISAPDPLASSSSLRLCESCCRATASRSFVSLE